MQNNDNSPGPTRNSANYQTSGSNEHKKLKKAILSVSGLLVVLLVVLGVQLSKKLSTTAPRVKEVICTLADGTSFTYAKPQYREDGKIESCESVFRDGSIECKAIYSYDSEGFLSEEKNTYFFQGTGVIDYEWTTFYEPGDEELKKRELYNNYNEDGRSIYHSEIVYQNGVKKSEHNIGYMDNGQCDYTNDSEFDLHGEIIKESFAFYSGGKYDDSPTISTYHNEYDENGNIIYSKMINEENSGSYAEDFFEYTFDSNGRILSKIQTLNHGYKSEFQNDDYSYVCKWFYNYDDHGNQTEYQYILSTEDEPDMVNNKTICTYDEDDRLLSKEEYEKGELQARYDYVYE